MALHGRLEPSGVDYQSLGEMRRCVKNDFEIVYWIPAHTKRRGRDPGLGSVQSGIDWP